MKYKPMCKKASSSNQRWYATLTICVANSPHIIFQGMHVRVHLLWTVMPLNMYIQKTLMLLHTKLIKHCYPLDWKWNGPLTCRQNCTPMPKSCSILYRSVHCVTASNICVHLQKYLLNRAATVQISRAGITSSCLISKFTLPPTASSIQYTYW